MNHTVWLRHLIIRPWEDTMTDDPNAAAEPDPGNSDPDAFTAPLDPTDDIFSRLLPGDQGDLRETEPAGEDRK